MLHIDGDSHDNVAVDNNLHNENTNQKRAKANKRQQQQKTC